MKFSIVRKVFPALACMVVFVASANAAVVPGTFTIFDTTDSLSSQALNFFGGANPSVDCGSQPETCTFTIVAPVGATAPITMSIDFRSVILTEGIGGPISDWLVCNDCSPTGASIYNFIFKSDVDGVVLIPPPSFLPPLLVLNEDGTAQNAMTISYFQGGNLIGTNIIRIQSDAPENVPEPSTWMTTLSGLGAVVFAAKRRAGLRKLR